MTRTLNALLAPCCALALTAGTAAAQDQPAKPPQETVGEKLDDALKSVKRGAREASETIHQQFERARTAVHNMGVSGRVYGRLHWDKDLQGAKINLDVTENGVATMTGTVPSAKAKSKAVSLAEDTVGVVKVIDRTTIQPATESPAPAAVTTPPAAKP